MFPYMFHQQSADFAKLPRLLSLLYLFSPRKMGEMFQFNKLFFQTGLIQPPTGYVRSDLNSHYFHIGDKLSNPIVGVYIPMV